MLLDVERLKKHSLLTDAERRRVEAVSWRAFEDALAHDAVFLEESDYPEALQEAGNQSPVLSVRGDVGALHAPCIALVGTRSASTYGKACAYKFSEALARAGVTVLSGGAVGIDAAAHRGALDAGGRTAAVLAGGNDHVYPSVHAGLFREITARGCLVSQYALGTKPNDYKFPARNQLIAALSVAVLVIEAPHKSGALITAHVANDLGRPVFVVPGNIDLENFAGSNSLIRDGATLVSYPAQILDELGIELAAPVAEAEPETEAGQKILRVLSTQATTVEKIGELTGLPAAEILGELTMLELDGRIFRDAGGYALKR